MSKLIQFLFISLALLMLPTNNVLALEECKGLEITSTPAGNITTNTQRATFTIDVGNAKAPGFSQWKAKFDCGTQPGGDATIDAKGSKISITRDSGTFACEFSAGTHNVIASAVILNGQIIDQCQMSYTVTDADNLCKLTITPKDNILSTSNIIVYGENINPRGNYNPLGYGLFLNGNAYALNVDKAGSTTFTYTIPEFLTPGYYSADIRYPTATGPLTAILATIPGVGLSVGGIGNTGKLKTYYGSPLCTTSFTVGTPANPGSAVGGASGPTNRRCTGSGCTLAVGKPCGSKEDPAIVTAIGCIHTNPISFIQDLLKFLTAIAGGFAFLLMVIGAFQMISSAGNPETLAAGRDRIKDAIIGLLFVIFAVLLLKIIGVDILGLEGFEK